MMTIRIVDTGVARPRAASRAVLRCRRCGGRLMAEPEPGQVEPELVCLQCGFRPRFMVITESGDRRLAS